MATSHVTAGAHSSTDVIEGQADELSTLARLQAHEQELSRRLEQARRMGEDRLIAAREEVAQLKAQEDATFNDELSRLREEHSGRLEAALADLRKGTAQQLEALARRAAANQERAFARLLAAITGSSRP